MRAAGDGVAAAADTGRLAEIVAGELPHRLVGERAASADDADVARFVDVARGDANAAATVGVFAGAGGDDAGTIRADEACFGSRDRGFDLNHVANRNAFSDGDDQLEPGVNRLEDGVGGEGWRNKNRGGGRAGFFDGLGHAVEDRHLIFKYLSGFAGSDSGDDLRTILEAELGVAAAEAAGDALDEDLGVCLDENCHVVTKSGLRLCGGLGDDFFRGLGHALSCDE